MNRVMAVFVVLFVFVLLFCSCSSLPEAQSCATREAENIKVVIVTGGHDFDREPFFELFDSFENIEYVEAAQSDESELFEDISGWDYDVIVLYNMTQEISPHRQENFVELLEEGIGVVAIHHSIGAFRGWPEYKRITGSRFYLEETREGGVVHKALSYKHDVDFEVHVKDLKHRVTQGLGDFLIHDEVYKDCAFEPDNHVLLTTNHPASDEAVCWVRNYANSRVCCIAMGHGGAYFNPNYRQLVGQAIYWSASSSQR